MGAAVLASWAAVFVAERRSVDRPPVSVRPLTFRSGYVATARFAPDGRTIVYGAAWDGGPVELYFMRLESPEAKSLGLPPAGILAISSQGEMAVSLGCQLMIGFGDCRGTLALVPSLTGGAPREVMEDVVGADFGPDGKELAVARLLGEKRRLEFPLGTAVYETSGGFIVHPRVSPRGDLVAFLEHPPGTGPWGSGPGALRVVDRKGAARTLASGFQWGQGLAWAPDGGEIWLTGGRRWGTRAVTLGGRERLIDQDRGRIVDLGAQGQALLLRGELHEGLVGLAPGETTERNLSWLNYSVPADLSADGRTLLFDERLAGATGEAFTVYIRKTDGSAAVKLGVGMAMALSPDGKWALAKTAPAAVVLLPTGAGAERSLSPGPIEAYQRGTFLPDNRGLLLVAREKGHPWRCYVQDLESGQVRAVTPEGVTGNVVSPDGASVVAATDDKPEAIYPLSGGTPRAIPGPQGDYETVRWSGDGRALYRVRSAGLRATLYRLDLASGRTDVLKELRPSDPAGIVDFADGVLVSADGRGYVYSYSRASGQLYLAEGLR